VSEYDIVMADRHHVTHVANLMREADAEELWATYGRDASVHKVLSTCYRVSRDTTYAGLADGEAICVFGVRPPSLLGAVAQPWMVGTDGVRTHSRAFLRFSRRVVRVLSREFPHMRNWVDERNSDAIRWLQWLGFQVYSPEPYGAERLPFCMFELRRD